MRYEWLAAAVAACLTVAGPAEATTVITQSVSSSYTPHASRGGSYIGGLTLAPGQTILSASFSYQYSGYSSEDYPAVLYSGPVTYTYSGSAGFEIGYNLPVPFFASSSAAGSTTCTAGSCGAGISSSGTINVPLADLAAFARPDRLYFDATGGITGRIDQGSYSLNSGFYNGAAGTMTYVLSDVPAIPEPATWAMLIAGAGLVGTALRRRPRAAVALA